MNALIILAEKVNTGAAIGVIGAAFAAGLAAGFIIYFKLIKKK